MTPGEKLVKFLDEYEKAQFDMYMKLVMEMCRLSKPAGP